MREGCIGLNYSVGMLVKIPSFSVCLAVSYLELFIPYDHWAGEHLVCEKRSPGSFVVGVQFRCLLLLSVPALAFGSAVGFGDLFCVRWGLPWRYCSVLAVRCWFE